MSPKIKKNLKKTAPKAERKDELKYHGWHACMALWQNRPSGIIRVYVTKPRVKACSDLLKYCADKRLAYHIVTDEEIKTIAASVHHDGICILAKELPVTDFDSFWRSLNKLPDAMAMIYLDGVQNPHNIGAILRVAAHFGVQYLLGKKGELPKLSASAMRVAEGGAEHVRLIAADDAAAALNLLKSKDFKLIGTSSHHGENLFKAKLPPRCVLMLGAESTGLSPQLAAKADLLIKIPGTDLVESLNVSVATGILMAAHYGQFRG